MKSNPINYEIVTKMDIKSNNTKKIYAEGERIPITCIVVFEKLPENDILKGICDKIRDMPIDIGDVKLLEYQERGEETINGYLAQFDEPVLIGFGRGARYFQDYNDYLLRFFVSPELNVLQNFKRRRYSRPSYLVLSESSEDEQKWQLYAPNFDRARRYKVERASPGIEVLKIIEELARQFIYDLIG